VRLPPRSTYQAHNDGDDGSARIRPASSIARSAMTARLSSRAEVATENPGRYAKQLVAHLGRRVEFTTDGDTSTAPIGTGTGTVVAGNDMLTLHAQAPDEAGLLQIQDVLGRHLERFGQRNELIDTWSAIDADS